jgi:DNA mismatch repair protein MutS2
MSINLVSSEIQAHHRQVEWDVLQGIISQFAHFESTQGKLCSQIFVNDSGQLEAEFTKIQSYVEKFTDEDRHLALHLLGSQPQDKSLHRYSLHLEKGGQLDFSELNILTKLLESAIHLKEEARSPDIEELRELDSLDFQTLKKSFLKEFRYLVEGDGSVHFDKHPELREADEKRKHIEARIRKEINEWIHSPDNQRLLQYQNYDVHYDRYVVPVRSDSYRADLGIIVSRSETGQTLFVEPHEMRTLCNQRIELIAKIDEIINQLSLKFTRSLFSHRELLAQCLLTIERLDFYLAKSSFALKYKLTRPLLRNKPGFKITALFHPLLNNPVSNDADCAQGNLGIVISGPNTGGKTVFLKSMALCYLLFNHGHFVPAANAELYPYEGIFYFGNDLQDIQHGLSSFSGEVRNYLNLIEHILPTNLILIDEIFNSTSSDEASALSLAYFQELHERAACHLIVSTHHQMFKTLIHQDRKYISAHVGFDLKEMKPTYKVHWGTPGASMAIDIFRILSRGHDQVTKVPENALLRMRTKDVSYETLLQKVSQKQIELDKLIQSNSQLEVELKNQKGAMEGILNLRLQDEMQKAKKEIDRILSEARSIVIRAKDGEITKIRKIDDKAHDLKASLPGASFEDNADPTLETGNLTLQDLAPGDTVHSIPMKKEFTVISLDQRKSEVLISKGAIKISVPVSTLKRTKGSKRSTPQVRVSLSQTLESNVEYDVRGMRLSEFQSLIDKALGHLLSGDVPYLNIIHGHGDGILKKWLRDSLKRSKDFDAGPPENGNDGETKISLK